MINKIIEEVINNKVNSKNVAILLSGGVDSISVAFACDNLKKKISAHSFKINNIKNYDSEMAEIISKKFNWLFHLHEIDKKNLEKDFHKLKELGCYKKTHFECIYPFLHLFQKIKEKYIITGWAADGYYGISKSAMINFREPKKKFDYFRNKYFMEHNRAGFFLLKKLSKLHNKILVAPYLSEEVKEFFYKKDWHELNKPFQKHHVRKSFNQFEKLPFIKKHINLQIGSGINKLFETLIDNKKINFKKRKRVMDICRDWSKI
tara:strand:- start:27 stop:812 length:786 start_codon:yes stop_codon:yes gene_type:complete